MRLRLALTLTIERKSKPEPDAEHREVDMGALVETYPQPRHIGFTREDET
jgi:hypothetical protein